MSIHSGKRWVILGTGGTIAGRAAAATDNVGYTAAQVSAAQLVADVPGLQGVPLEIEQVAQLDSKDMNHAVWRHLLGRVVHHLQRTDVQGVIITHGTDTLEETAYFLHLSLVGSGLEWKPVVLTCAMRPATSQSPDGPQNLRDAVAVATDPHARGVVAVCAGTVHGAQAVQKTHSYRLDAFSSGDAGPLGFVEEGAVRWTHTAEAKPVVSAADMSLSAIENIVKTPFWPRVEVVISHAGVDGSVVDLLLQARCSNANAANAANASSDAPVHSGIQGLVVAGTGNGTVHADLQAALLRATAAGVRVWRTSRCAFGHVPAIPGDEALPGAGDLSPVKARVALMLQLLGEQSN